MVRTRTRNFDNEQLSEFEIHQRKYGKRFASLLGLGIGMGVLAGLLSLLVGGTPKVAEEITNTTGDVASNVGDAADGVAGTVGEAGSNIVEGGKDVATNVGDAADGVAGTVGEAGSNIVEGGKDVAGNVGDATKDITGKTGELGSNVGDAAGNAADGVAETVGEAGSNIVEGGKDVAANVGDVTGNAATQVVDTAKNTTVAVGTAVSGVGIGKALDDLKSGAWDVNQAIPLKVDKPIEFGYNSAVLTGEGKQVVSELAKEIQQLDAEQVAVKIVGHTSKTGNPETNLLLSRQRASAVATELRNLDVQNNIDTEGKGYSEPIANIPADDVHQQRTEVQLIRVK